MKKQLLMMMVIVMMVVFPLAAQDGGYGGGKGKGKNGNGGSGGGGCNPGSNLLTGTPFSFSGKVIAVAYDGNGLSVSTDSGTVAVFGLGPVYYWNQLNMTRPEVGDTVSAEGYTVNYNGDVRNVLTNITVNGTLVPLRDASGNPLWRGNGGHWAGTPGTGGFGACYDILAGVPFTWTGEIISCSVNEHGVQSNGLVIATAAGNVIVSGIGPVYYWNNLGLEHPAAGDVITVSGFTADFSGVSVNVLMSVVLEDGTNVQLRDAETGSPLWRMQGDKQ